ncbi:MAG: branched-chain amino acid aminotransferase [Reyranella sp.]|uniref:branched-chain amino acid aminotransferase n=1 Tax=Reyranella sp. TaxID=1929291 RepID=UPI00120A4DF8|nr:branched-chain amino acid aminotransferase [Reyranella sp.]TAJ96267.1 MAG: branched-chain amino acid aminotransferase [Reyranella sp.]TBR25020.1 MAG: branched-chain amino acid aminotransferase [Reyranella sp.]
MDTLTYWNGTWHEGNPAILGPRDHAFWLGSMVFDGGRAFEGCGPDLDLHAERVVRSARAIGLNPTQTPEEILKLMHESVRRFGPKAELYVRPMFWAGKGGAGPISVDPDSAQFLLCTYISPMRAGTPLTLGLCRSIRRPAPETAPTDAKASCLYPNSSRGVAEMLKRGFNNGVVLDPLGNVAETCSSNLFIARNGLVATPVPNGSFLAGITRYRTIRLLRSAGITVEERTIRPAELEEADEMFTTGNAGKVQSVSRYEGRDMQPGPIAARAHDLYMAFARTQRVI